VYVKTMRSCERNRCALEKTTWLDTPVNRTQPTPYPAAVKGRTLPSKNATMLTEAR
jgi:hypothetical protein